jgi:hypothetical protein
MVFLCDFCILRLMAKRVADKEIPCFLIFL